MSVQLIKLLTEAAPYVPADTPLAKRIAMAVAGGGSRAKKDKGPYRRCVVRFEDGVEIRTGTYGATWDRAIAFAELRRRTSPEFGFAVLNRDAVRGIRGDKRPAPRYEWRRAEKGESKYPGRWGCFLVKTPIPAVVAVEEIAQKAA